MQPDQEVIFLHSDLLALVYYPTFGSDFRRGIIWDWTTGRLVYVCIIFYYHDDFRSNSIQDSEKTSNPGGFRDLLLSPLPGCFVISTLTPEGLPPCRSGCIELRVFVEVSRSSPATSELVGIFHLPQLSISTNGSVRGLDFFSGVPFDRDRSSTSNGDSFPFDSNPETSVHLLYLSYEEAVESFNDGRAYLVISNQVYIDALRQWLSWKGRIQRSENDQRFPLNLDWPAWAPRWTSMWDRDEIGELSR